jgi:hypothetical protein
MAGPVSRHVREEHVVAAEVAAFEARPGLGLDPDVRRYLVHDGPPLAPGITSLSVVLSYWRRVGSSAEEGTHQEDRLRRADALEPGDS